MHWRVGHVTALAGITDFRGEGGGRGRGGGERGCLFFFGGGGGVGSFICLSCGDVCVLSCGGCV